MSTTKFVLFWVKIELPRSPRTFFWKPSSGNGKIWQTLSTLRSLPPSANSASRAGSPILKEYRWQDNDKQWGIQIIISPSNPLTWRLVEL